MRRHYGVLLLLFVTSNTLAQIGYQVSLLNSATGQPRAGETVTVDIKLTNSENTEVYTTQQKATSNDFGVLSLSVGDAQTFEELDWNKLPLYIEVSIDGIFIAKSQVLSVPVAEYAKKSGFVLTKEFLASRTWTCTYSSWYTRNISFSLNGYMTYSVICHVEDDCLSFTRSYPYDIVNDRVYFYRSDDDTNELMVAGHIVYNPNRNVIMYSYDSGGYYLFK